MQLLLRSSTDKGSSLLYVSKRRGTNTDVLHLVGIHRIVGDWVKEARWLLVQRGRSLDELICKLLLIQCICEVWLERNCHVFCRQQLSTDSIASKIVDTVRLRLIAWPKLQQKLSLSKLAGALGLCV